MRVRRPSRVAYCVRVGNDPSCTAQRVLWLGIDWTRSIWPSRSYSLRKNVALKLSLILSWAFLSTVSKSRLRDGYTNANQISNIELSDHLLIRINTLISISYFDWPLPFVNQRKRHLYSWMAIWMENLTNYLIVIEESNTLKIHLSCNEIWFKFGWFNWNQW